MDDSVSRRVPAGDQDPKFREQGLHFGGELAGCLERAAAGAISFLLQRLLHMESWVAGAVRKSPPRLERSVIAGGSPKLRQLPALLLPLVSLTAL